MSTDLATLSLAIDSSQVRKANSDLDSFEKGAKKAETATESFQRGVSRMMSVAAGFGLSLGIRELIQYADTQKLIQSRLNLVTKSKEELAAVEERLFAISQNSRNSYESTAELYSRVARASKTLGASQGDLLKMTETINKAITISGGSAQSTQAALIQLSQGFASGTLRGQELNSILEQAPRLAEAIAAGMGKTTGELRKLGEQDKLTAKTVFDSLKNQADVINQEFSKIPVTVGQAFIQLDNAFGKAVGGADKAKGATGLLADSISKLAQFTEDYGAKVVAAFSPAINIAIAYFGVFKVAPMIFAAMSGGLNGVAISAQLASGALTKMALAGNVLIAIFSGWQIGTYLREQFVEARVAGLAFVGAILKGWEHVKYGGQLAWEAIKATFNGVINSIKGSFGSYIELIGKGMQLAGADDSAQKVLGFAAALKSGKSASDEFSAAKARLDAAHQKEIGAIDDNITGLIAYELNSGKAAKAVVDLTAKTGGESGAAGLAGAAKKAADKIREVVDALKLEVSLIGLSAETQEYYNKLKESGVKSNSKEAESIRALIAEKYALNYENNLLVEYTRQQEDERKKYNDTLNQSIEQDKSALEQLKKQNEEYGKSAEEIANLNIVKIQSALDSAEQQKAIEGETGAIELQIAALKDRLNIAKEYSGQTAISGALKAADDAAKAAVDAAKQVDDEFKKTTESIQSTLTDALMRGFESGKDFAKNFKDTLKNMFQTLVIRPIISPIMGSIAGGISSLLTPGVANASQFGGSAGGIGSLGGLGDIFSKGADMFSGAIDSISGLFGAASSASAIAGGGASSLGMMGLSGMTGASGLGTGLMSGLTSALGMLGPIAAGAGLLYSAFKPGKREETGKGISGTATSSGFSGDWYDAWEKKGGFLKGSSSGRDSSNLGLVSGGKYQDFIDSGIKNVTASFETIGKQIGLDATAMLANFKLTFDVNVGEFSDSAIFGALQVKLTEITDAMANQLVPGLDAFAKAGETASQTLNRIVLNANTFNNVLSNIGFDTGSMFDNLGFSDYTKQITESLTESAINSISAPVKPVNPFAFTPPELIQESDIASMGDKLRQYEADLKEFDKSIGDVSFSSADASVQAQALAIAILDMKNKLIEGAGGIEEFSKKTAFYYENFFSEQERQQKAVELAQKSLTDEFSKFTTAVPESRDAYRKLVESQDLTTESGRNMFNMLLNMAPAFTLVSQSMDKSAEAAAGLAQQQEDLLKKQANGILDAMKTLLQLLDDVEQFKAGIGDSIQSIRASMKSFNSVDYYGGQVTNLESQLANASGVESQLAIGGKLKDAIMNRYNAEIDLLGKTHDQKLQALTNEQSAYEEAHKQEMDNLKQYQDGLKNIADYAKSLLLSDLSPLTNKQRLDESQTQYQDILAKAQGGDAGALGQLSGSASNYLKEAQSYYASSPDYTGIFGGVQGQLSALGATTVPDSEAATAEYQRQTLDYQSRIEQMQFDFETQTLALQQSAIDSLLGLQIQAQIWQDGLNTSLEDQAILFTDLNLSLGQVVENTADLDQRIADKINAALAAKAAAEQAIANANTEKIVQQLKLSEDNSARMLASAIASINSTARR